MKYVDEFRDPAKAKVLFREIEDLVGRIDLCRTRPLRVMEVCGGHTHSIFRYGLDLCKSSLIELLYTAGFGISSLIC